MKFEGADGIQSGEQLSSWSREGAQDPEEFVRKMYGVIPSELPDVTAEVREVGTAVFNVDGKEYHARRKQTRLFLEREGKLPVDLLTYYPDSVVPAPLVLSANLHGNHAAVLDTNVYFPQHLRTTSFPMPGLPLRPNEAQRGMFQEQFPVAEIIASGRVASTFYYGDVDPDFNDGFKNGIHGLYPDLQGRLDHFASIGGWATGIRAVKKHLSLDPLIDTKLTSVVEFSRLAKTALLVGALDSSIPVIISEASGRGGIAPLTGVEGESFLRMCLVFPHWCPKSAWEIIKNPRKFQSDQYAFLSGIQANVLASVGGHDTHSDPKGQEDTVREVNAHTSRNGHEPRFRFRKTKGRNHKMTKDLWPGYFQFMEANGC